MDAFAVTPAPHVVFRLDRRGKVIDFEDVLASDSFIGTAPSCGSDIHRCLHPTCGDISCKVRLCLHEGLNRIERSRIVEWECFDGNTRRTLRMHLRKAADGARTWATLTVTDITEGRQAASALREVNRLLGEVTRRSKAGAVTERVRLDRKLRSMTAELIAAQEKERQRIALELHDGVGQLLAIAKLSLESGMHRYGQPAGRADLERALANLQSGIAEVRATVRNLRPTVLEEFGLVATVELICHDLQLSFPAMNISCEIEGAQDHIEPLLQVAIVRILQEATNNACKHAQARHLRVGLNLSQGFVSLVVSDDGKGLAPEDRSRGGGLGLRGMRERATNTGGELSITGSPSRGTMITVIWDKKAASAQTGTHRIMVEAEALRPGSK